MEEREREYEASIEEDAHIKERVINAIAASTLHRVSSTGGSLDGALGDLGDVEGAVEGDYGRGTLGPEDVKQELFHNIHVHYPQAEDFKRVLIYGGSAEYEDPDTSTACKQLKTALELREKWMRVGPARPVEGRRCMPPVVEDTQPAAAGADASLDMSGAGGAVNDTYIPADMSRSPLVSPARPEGGTTSSNNMRTKWRRRPEPAYDPFAPDDVPKTNHGIEVVQGVYHAVLEGQEASAVPAVPSVYDFFHDLRELNLIVNSGPVKSLAFQRIQLLEARFNLHVLLNSEAELAAQKSVPHRDFYNIRKVDTHVHHSACMNQKHLLRFIKHKLKHCPNEIVSFRDGRFMTLREVFKSLRLNAYDLSVDTLDMHANNTFHRFDRFNLKYNPAGQSRLREIFLKTDNLIAGQYLAQVTREVITDLEASKYQMVEWRLSIYGRRMSEWDKLARWFFMNRLAHNNVRWMIQIPRLYHVYRKTGEVSVFQDMIDRIFRPLFEVSIDPDTNLPLHAFLKTVVGFDSVDDESKVEQVQLHPERYLPMPKEWDLPENPPYSYWTYYMAANVTSLNILRESKGLNTFEFRPHCGEAGDAEHMAACFLVADQINHGIMLRKSPGLQYLYYLKQMGIAMSPLSNNKLFLDYAKNPFPKYFAQGMNVSLSTDDPVMLHYTKDPLLEEYSVAAQVWRLSSVDQCEIARNSVLQSGYEHRFKQHFLGENYHKGAEGNDIRQTNVPDIRLRYRDEVLSRELQYIDSGGATVKLSQAELAATGVA